MLAVEELLDRLRDVGDVTKFSLHTLYIVLRVLDGHRVLDAQRGDLGGYVDYRDDACCARKAVHNKKSATEMKYTSRLRFASL